MWTTKHELATPPPGHVRGTTVVNSVDELSLSDDSPTTGAEAVAWNLDSLLGDHPVGAAGVEALLGEAEGLAAQFAAARGTIAELDAAGLAALMTTMAELDDRVGRAHSYVGLAFSTDTQDSERAALMQATEERIARLTTDLLFFDLEWAELDDDAVEALLASDGLAFCAHHLRSMRRYRPHLLTEAEEKILVEKSVSGASAWVRLFEELTAAVEVELSEPDGTTSTQGLEAGLSRLADPDPGVRRSAAEAVTAGLAPGLSTRAFILNTLANDKAVDDRLRSYDSWISSRNLSNEASDESVQALVTAVKARYDIPQRWYALKAELLGVERLADHDRMASIAETDERIEWGDARDLVLDAYDSFSPVLATTARRFFDENWIDAPTRPGKRPGAFCAYTVPSHHPYVLLNWTGRRRDVLTLAHELGHGLHAHLARPQGIFHQSTPLTLAETASVFGETVTFGRLLEDTSDPSERLALLASQLEDSIATVFRQTAMNQFEAAVHGERRTEGELSVDRIGELWASTQADMLGDAVEITEGYRTWWSYIPHFIATPGYVYAYAYGQLLALSVYRRYAEQGDAFVDAYLDLLSAGGSMPPEELGQIVGCDLADPGFWDGGLDIIADQLRAAVSAAEGVLRATPPAT